MSRIALDGHPALRGQPAAAGNSDNDAIKKTTIATTREDSTPINVYCLSEEKQQIEANAATLCAVLAKIERTQDEMLEVTQTVVMSKGRRDVN